MTIEFLLAAGFLAGLVVGGAIRKLTIGCGVLLLVPVAMIVYIELWQAANPDKLTSTSAVDFIFGPLWPSLGAIAGMGVARLVRFLLSR